MTTVNRYLATTNQVSDMHKLVKQMRKRIVASAASGSEVFFATVPIIADKNKACTMSGPEMELDAEEYRAVTKQVTKLDDNCVPHNTKKVSFNKWGAAS